MSPKKTPSAAPTPQTKPPKAQPSSKRESLTPAPPAVEITLSLGWLLLCLGGLSIVAISLLHQEPLLLAISRAAAWMLLLGFLIYYLADGIMRTLLKAKAPATREPATEDKTSPTSTRDVSV